MASRIAWWCCRMDWMLHLSGQIHEQSRGFQCLFPTPFFQSLCALFTERKNPSRSYLYFAVWAYSYIHGHYVLKRNFHSHWITKHKWEQTLHQNSSRPQRSPSVPPYILSIVKKIKDIQLKFRNKWQNNTWKSSCVVHWNRMCVDFKLAYMSNEVLFHF